MKITRFITLVFVAASLIVGGVYLNQQATRTSVDPSTSGHHRAPEHYFLAHDRPTPVRIDCPMARLTNHRDVWVRELPPCWLAGGWTPPQSWGSWATGLVSRVEVDLKTTAARSLVIRAFAYEELPHDQQQAVTVTVNGLDLGKQRISRTWTILRYHIPEGVLRVGSNSISLKFDFRISPLESGKSKDHRALAAGVGEVTLMAPVGFWSGGSSSKPRVNIWSEKRRRFIVGQPGVVVLPAFIPPGTAMIEFKMRASMSVDSSKVRALLAVEDLDGGSSHNSEMTFPPGKSLSTARLPVADLADRWALVTIDTAIDTGNLEISRMRFVPDDHPTKNTATPALLDDTQSQPDIVLITLDAARADHFSYAGHSRDTTPFIDDLSRESIVFPNAYALAPYTLCSVPTMITGLSFLDHRVVKHADVLNQDAVTLAESLRHAGYHTAAFSATPNNSKAKGFDQGYDVFREVWTEEPQQDTRRAHFIAQRVVEWLDSIENDARPLHLQVHMVPPHAPYDPPAAFDQFSDPTYDGPCDGFHRTISALDGGSMEPTPECLDHLLDLYDGNLRAADDAVRIIVEALRKRPRWNNTVVLVTSDHGEAFMDHGRMDHNSTLFSEMLHVPFVLRMPPGHDGSAIDTGQLVTLADITPTLLRAAGLTAPHTMDSVDLLTPNLVSGSRFLVTRTATFAPILGIRTLRWSLMVSAAGSGALFDLATDPHERLDIHSGHAARYAGLGKILAARTSLPAQLVVAAETADITEDERALLETLGYIR